MKKYLIILFIALSTNTFAQNELTQLNFDTNYYDAVNKWVAFPVNEDGKSHNFGIIYIDQMAGFTYKYENDLIIENNTIVIDTIIHNKSISMISRLSKNTKKVAILNAKQIEVLKLNDKSKWLDVYTSNENSVEYLTKIGYHYNHIGASQNAIKPLLKAYTMDKAHPNLAFELGFAYNATQQFLKAIPVIKEGIKTDSKNHYLYKELGYAYLGSGDLKNADLIYTKGIKVSRNDAIKCEMAVNMANGYFNSKNKKELKKWCDIGRKYSSKTPKYIQYFDYYEKEIDKN